VNLPQRGGNTASSASGGSTDGRHGTMALTNWTYAAAARPHRPLGWLRQPHDLMPPGITNTSALGRPHNGARRAIGKPLRQQLRDIQNFTSTFEFQMRGGGLASGDGLTFIIQADTGHGAVQTTASRSCG